MYFLLSLCESIKLRLSSNIIYAKISTNFRPGVFYSTLAAHGLTVYLHSEEKTHPYALTLTYPHYLHFQSYEWEREWEEERGRGERERDGEGDDKSNEERNEMRETETFVYFLLSSFCIFVMSVEKSNKKIDLCYLLNLTLYNSN